jgi:hypothetical protein
VIENTNRQTEIEIESEKPERKNRQIDKKKIRIKLDSK